MGFLKRQRWVWGMDDLLISRSWGLTFAECQSEMIDALARLIGGVREADDAWHEAVIGSRAEVREAVAFAPPDAPFRRDVRLVPNSRVHPSARPSGERVETFWILPIEMATRLGYQPFTVELARKNSQAALVSRPADPGRTKRVEGSRAPRD